MAQRKGITPVIAVLLLLMMTVAAAGGAYVWMQNLQEQIQQESSERLRQQTQTGIQLVQLSCYNDGSDGYTVEALLKNNGQTQLDLDPVDLNVRDSSTGDINLDLSRSSISLSSGSTSRGVEIISDSSEDFSEPGERTNYQIADPDSSEEFDVNSYYTIEFVFTDVANGMTVTGECQAEGA